MNNYLEVQIHREAERLINDLAILARRALSADVFLRATIVPGALDWSMHRAASPKHTRRTGETHVIIAAEHYDLN